MEFRDESLRCFCVQELGEALKAVCEEKEHRGERTHQERISGVCRADRRCSQPQKPSLEALKLHSADISLSADEPSPSKRACTRTMEDEWTVMRDQGASSLRSSVFFRSRSEAFP